MAIKVPTLLVRRKTIYSSCLSSFSASFFLFSFFFGRKKTRWSKSCCCCCCWPAVWRATWDVGRRDGGRGICFIYCFIRVFGIYSTSLLFSFEKEESEAEVKLSIVCLGFTSLRIEESMKSNQIFGCRYCHPWTDQATCRNFCCANCCSGQASREIKLIFVGLRWLLRHEISPKFLLLRLVSLKRYSY